MEQLKGANKAVKYGKIGQNKKDGDEGGTPYGGKIIRYEDDEN